MQVSVYARVAQIRLRELKTRMVLAAFIGGVSWMIAPSWWPVVWFVAVGLTQAMDWVVFRPLRLDPERQVGRAEEALYCLNVAVIVAVYSGMSAYLWFNGGDAGRLFALLQTAGGLLHVSLHMHHVRALLVSAALPHGLYFLGLPVLSAIMTRDISQLAIACGGMLYIMHLVVAVRQSAATARAMTQAGAEAREERRKAEIANAAKSDFLAVISHEIRTPMNAVISAANLLRRTRLDREQREHVSMLLDAGDVLVGLLNDVLDLSKIEAGKMTLESAEMDLRDKLASANRLWESRAMANGVRLRIAVAPEAPDAVRTDPLRFQQILFNLLSNAVKFTESGEIEVTVGWIAETNVLTIAVRDTGCGIPAERLAHIFESFEQVEAGTTRRYGGTGLGLAISRKLARMMGGDLTAKSQRDEGSIFRLSLPVEPIVKAAPSRRRAVEVVSLSGCSILAADDHAVNRRILTLLLEPHGCRLTLVENGAEAVEAATAQRFDAILMDMQMPVMDGLEATRRIRDTVLNGDTPVVALTANALDIHRAAWDAAGVAGFLTKPIDPALLAATLAEACAEAAERGAGQAVVTAVAS